MKFSSNPENLSYTLEKVVNDHKVLIDVFEKKCIIYYDTYMDNYLFNVVFSKTLYNKREEMWGRGNDYMAVIPIKIQECKNPNFSIIKYIKSLFPNAEKYAVPYWIDKEINKEDVEESKRNKRYYREVHGRNRGLLKREFKEFKSVIKARESLNNIYNTYNQRTYNFKSPTNYGLNDYIERLNNNALILEDFISKIEIARKVDSDKVELSDDDISSLDNIVNSYNNMSKINDKVG